MNARMAGAPHGLLRLGARGPKTILTTSAAGPTTSTISCQEAKYWTDWTFTLAGTFTGYSVLIQGSEDGVTWFTLMDPSIQGGEGVSANPLTSTIQSLRYKGSLFDVRAIATGTAQTGTVNVNVTATP